MKHLRKHLALLLVLLFAFAAFAGCAPQSDVPDNNTPPPGDTADKPAVPDKPADEDPVTIEFWWAPTFADEETNRAWIDEALAGFYDEHPNVTVNFTLIPWAEYASKLALVLSDGKDAPDIFYTYPEQVWEFAEAGWLAPVDEYFTAEDLEDFYGVADGSYKGNFYMPPILYSEYAYVYNGDILDEIGWDRAKLPTTIAEMDGLFAAAHEKGYYAGGLAMYLYDHLNPILHFAWGKGYDYVDRNGNVTCPNDALKTVFEYQKKWVDAGYVRNDAWIMGDTYNADVSAFLGGDQLMCFVPAMNLRADDYQNSDIDWLIGPFPKLDASAKNVGVGIACGFAMTEAGQNKALAGEILNILTNAQNQVTFNEKVGYMCARKSCGNIFADLRGFDELAKVYEGLDESYGATWHFITSSLANSIMSERQAMYMGTQTVDETLTRIGKLLQEGLDNQ